MFKLVGYDWLCNILFCLRVRLIYVKHNKAYVFIYDTISINTYLSIKNIYIYIFTVYVEMLCVFIEIEFIGGNNTDDPSLKQECVVFDE